MFGGKPIPKELAIELQKVDVLPTAEGAGGGPAESRATLNLLAPGR